MKAPEECALCGRDPATGYASAYEDGTDYPLCHGDDDPTPTCYELWHDGKRPEVTA